MHFTSGIFLLLSYLYLTNANIPILNNEKYTKNIKQSEIYTKNTQSNENYMRIFSTTYNTYTKRPYLSTILYNRTHIWCIQYNNLSQFGYLMNGISYLPRRKSYENLPEQNPKNLLVIPFLGDDYRTSIIVELCDSDGKIRSSCISNKIYSSYNYIGNPHIISNGDVYAISSDPITGYSIIVKIDFVNEKLLQVYNFNESKRVTSSVLDYTNSILYIAHENDNNINITGISLVTYEKVKYCFILHNDDSYSIKLMFNDEEEQLYNIMKKDERIKLQIINFDNKEKGCNKKTIMDYKDLQFFISGIFVFIDNIHKNPHKESRINSTENFHYKDKNINGFSSTEGKKPVLFSIMEKAKSDRYFVESDLRNNIYRYIPFPPEKIPLGMWI